MHTLSGVCSGHHTPAHPHTQDQHGFDHVGHRRCALAAESIPNVPSNDVRTDAFTHRGDGVTLHPFTAGVRVHRRRARQIVYVDIPLLGGIRARGWNQVSPSYHSLDQSLRPRCSHSHVDSSHTVTPWHPCTLRLSHPRTHPRTHPHTLPSSQQLTQSLILLDSSLSSATLPQPHREYGLLHARFGRL
jgi:hypothetical protein